jgi:exo-1,4-beta-D-glucosaminidase
MESVPRLNSIEKAIPGAGILDSTGSWTSKALVDHGLQIDGFTTRMTSTIGAPVSLADFVAMADLLSAQSYRAIFEAANKNRPRNPGTMVWMTNAAWLDFNYQMYDWYMHPTASYYSVRSANKPLHVQYAADDNTLQVVSTLPDAVHVHVKATLASADGATQDRKEYDLTALADKTTTVGLARLP